MNVIDKAELLLDIIEGAEGSMSVKTTGVNDVLRPLLDACKATNRYLLDEHTIGRDDPCERCECDKETCDGAQARTGELKCLNKESYDRMIKAIDALTLDVPEDDK